MNINKIGVLGAGTMGAGIAQICAQAGYQVVLIDIEQTMLDKGLKTINKSWAKAVEKGKLAEDDTKKMLAYLQRH